MYKAQEIADWFIARSRAEIRLDDSAEPITNMKLQKLMYFAQGIYLAIYDSKLFDDDFYAFKYGPVTQTIYDKYSGQRNLPEFNEDISEEKTLELAKNYDRVTSNEKAADVLLTTWIEYGKYTASELVRLTHDEKGPWKKVYKDSLFWNPMDDNDIKQYFKEYVVEKN